jgi:aminopeptidase N
VTSEDFRLAALTVTAPDRYRVLGSGEPAGTQPGPAPGTTTHRFTAEAVRDVAVSVGDLQVLERSAGDTRLHVGVPARGSRVDAEGWADALAGMTAKLEGFLGPYPYPDLWATVVPTLGDGVEFPTALQFGDVGGDAVPSLVAHEVAHMWFYALLGNNQARDPWIDEAFATYAQARAAGQEDYYDLSEIGGRVRGQLGEPMSYWADDGGFGRYVRGVYDQGAAVLLEGRRRAGAERFDAAMAAYLDADAHRVVSPADVAAAFRDVPEVLDLLREHGALPAGT